MFIIADDPGKKNGAKVTAKLRIVQELSMTCEDLKQTSVDF
jgi:hypothetical protein